MWFGSLSMTIGHSRPSPASGPNFEATVALNPNQSPTLISSTAFDHVAECYRRADPSQGHAGDPHHRRRATFG
jgi:hypothetical protein